MSTSISIKELKELDPSSYQIVDIRDAVEISHGAIPGALVMKTEEIETSDAIDRSKKTIICCSRGRFSVAAAEELQEKGWDAVSLADGCDERAGGAGQGGRRGEESPQKIQKVDLVQIYESDQYVRAGKTGRQNCCLYFRRKRFDADGEMLSGVKASQ